MVAEERGQEVSITIDGRVILCAPGRPLLNAILSAGLLVETACGGQGTCHLCRVTVVRAAPTLPPANSIETKALGNVLLAQGMRLSCQVPTEAGLEVRLPVFETPEARRERIRQARARKGKR